ncbi:VTT domain-containing protein [Candidatus Woesearchaeota archaeon]|nr:VTT domain-containing protein [Candidatus Woesearchaeota archaeon]
MPIPSTPIVFAGGYVYGTLVGSILAVIATVIGAAISFYLVRKFGEPLLELLMNKRHLEHFNHLFKKRGVSIALISYIVPVFPSDIVGLLMGLTKIRFHTFLAVAIVGNIPRCFVLNALGSDVYTGFTVKTFLLLVLVLIFAVMAIFREKLKRLMFRELRELEHEAVAVEKEVEREMGGVRKEVGVKKKRKVTKRKKR